MLGCNRGQVCLLTFPPRTIACSASLLALPAWLPPAPSSALPNRYVMIVAIIASAGGLLFGEPCKGQPGAGSKEGLHCKPVLLAGSARAGGGSGVPHWRPHVQAAEAACFTGGPPCLPALLTQRCNLRKCPSCRRLRHCEQLTHGCKLVVPCILWLCHALSVQRWHMQAPRLA